jgi:K+-sensing histidine kinase KdpD
MKATCLPTQFAPAERSTREEIRNEVSEISEIPYIALALDAIPTMAMVLNEHRQIVVVNSVLKKNLGIQNLDDILGLRPGEALACINAEINEGGCGTAKNCQYCGAVLAILSSLAGDSSEKECKITRKQDSKSINLKINAIPVTVEGKHYSVVSATDISSEVWRRMLERLFFHDILNTVSAAQGAMHLLSDITPRIFKKSHKFMNISLEGINAIIESIQSHRDLMAAENSELTSTVNELNSLEILRDLCLLYKKHKVASEKHIEVDASSPAITFMSDKVLLKRVIGNMTKNALEASEKGASTTMGCYGENDRVVFWVRNMTYIPDDIQSQLFKRSFSTKGAGRGLGTYSIKLLSEQYLEGKVWFESTIQHGTSFYVSLPAKPPKAS